MAENKSSIAKDILRRVRWLYLFFLLAAVAIVGRIIWIQYGPEGDELRAMAEEATFDWRALPAERGDILARDGRILATTIPEYEIRMDFNAVAMPDSIYVKSADSLARELSSFFGDRSYEAYKATLLQCHKEKHKNKYVNILPRKISYTEEKQISRFPIFNKGQYRGGYIKKQLSKRFMPMKPLARSALGTVGNMGVNGGVEQRYDSLLRGTDGNSLMQKISGTFWLPVPDPMNIEPVNGLDVVTTLDADIQDVAETMLRKQVAECNAYWGTVMLMEVESGEIRAMCNLTRQNDGTYDEVFNHAIRTPSEPGSTFKLASLLALLEDGGMSINAMIDCRSDASLRANVGGKSVRDDHRCNIQTLKQTFEQSSNIGFARSVYGVYSHDPSRFVNFVKGNLGFGDRTGIDLPSERKPDIKDPTDRSRWDGTSLQMMSYGYAFEVTPLQTLMLYNSVANNGRMMRPMVVKQIRSYGDTVQTFEPEVLIEAIASPAAIRAARECLEGVVDEGTGRVMRSAYYRAAAKTGTAQQVITTGRGYAYANGSMDILTTFVGYFPADNPKYSCIVAIKAYEPRGKRFYGGSLAGPVFREIADRVYASSISLHNKDYGTQRRLPEPSAIKGGRGEQVAIVGSGLGIPMGMDMTGSEWWTPAGEATVRHTADNGEETAADMPTYEAGEEMAAVPQVVGMGLKDALYLLENSGLKVTFTGKGRVVSQSARAGSSVPRQSTVHLKLHI